MKMYNLILSVDMKMIIYIYGYFHSDSLNNSNVDVKCDFLFKEECILYFEHTWCQLEFDSNWAIVNWR